MKKINFCKATTIILIINVILSIVLFFVVPDKIAIQWVGTSPSNAVDSYYVFLVPVLSVLFAFTGKPIFTMFLFRLWNRTNEHLVTYLNLCLQVVFLTCEIYIGLYKQRFTRGYKRYKETSGLMEWKIGHIFHSIFT